MLTPTPAAAVISIVSASIEKSIVTMRSMARYARTPDIFMLNGSQIFQLCFRYKANRF